MESESILYSNYQRVEELLNLISSDVSKGKMRSAIVRAQSTAHIAWKMHSGLYSIPELEELLRSFKATNVLTSKGSKLVRGNSKRPSIMHIISVTTLVGGHTRSMMRWIYNTKTEYNNSVIITKQIKLPNQIERELRTMKVPYVNLGGILDPVRKVEALSSYIDDSLSLIILHINPDDVITPIALEQNSSIPVIFFNHADHVYWTGSSVADNIVNIRENAFALSQKRRGTKTNSILPIPLTSSKTPVSKELAKRSLGLHHDDLVISSMASDYKYAPFRGKGIVNNIDRILKSKPNVVFLGIGPLETGNLASLKRKYGNRVRLFGNVPNPALQLSATDIYVDSSPMGSLTSALEAAKYSIPVMSIKQDDLPMMSLDDLALNGFEEIGISNSSFEEHMFELLADVKMRERIGTAMKASVEDIHEHSKWSDSLKRIYEKTYHSIDLTVSGDKIENIERFDYNMAELSREWDGRRDMLGLEEHLYRWVIAHSNRLNVTAVYDRIRYLVESGANKLTR